MTPTLKPQFSGRAFVKHGVWLSGTFHPAGSIIMCSAAEFAAAAESGRAVEFDPENPEHEEALAKSKAAPRKAKE